MAKYRNISMTFWTDPKVDDDFTPEDKYFYLYLLTNPHTNICGCYEVSMKQMERETGYNSDTVMRLIHRMEFIHKVIRYSEDTKELLLLNWGKYNWSNSEKLKMAVLGVAAHIKSEVFKKYVEDRVCIPYGYPMDTSITDTDTESESESEPEPDTESEIETEYRYRDRDSSEAAKPQKYASEIAEVIAHLNSKAGTKYRSSTQATRRHLNARFSEGFTVDDCKTVIDKKCAEWRGTEFEKFLRPETLFGSKFESYLNAQKTDQKHFENERYVKGGKTYDKYGDEFI